MREGRRPAARPSACRRRWLFSLSIQSRPSLCASIRRSFRYIFESGLGFVPGKVLLMENFNRRQLLLLWIRSEEVGRRLVATVFVWGHVLLREAEATIAPSSPFKLPRGWRLPQLCVVGKVFGRWRLTQPCVAVSCSEGWRISLPYLVGSWFLSRFGLGFFFSCFFLSLSVEIRGRSLVVGRERCLVQVGDVPCGGDFLWCLLERWRLWSRYGDWSIR